MAEGGWFETHAHLSDPQFDADRDDVIRRAVSAGVDTIVEIADGPDEWSKAQALSNRHPDRVLWAAGIHPYYADQPTSENWTELKRLAAQPRFVAIGEIGLDYFKCKVPHEIQKETFVKALQLADEVKKPVIVHCREAYADLLPLLKSHFADGKRSERSGVVHCFSGTADDARAAIDLGFFLGVDGPVTYPNSKNLVAVLNEIPLDHWVLETDSPYLPPQPFRGQRNEPARLPMIGSELANVTHQPLFRVRETTAQNAAELFRLKHR